MRLTASALKTLTLPKGKDDHIHFDERLPGFGLRQRKGGKQSFVYQYAIAGRTRKFTIGNPDPDKAFKIAKDLPCASALRSRSRRREEAVPRSCWRDNGCGAATLSRP
jgi:hypothetical protein